MPTDRAKYKRIVESIFGANTCKLDVASATTNNVIGALASAEYSVFHANFVARVRRLQSAYATQAGVLVDLVNLVGGPQWQGAVAELAAMDFFTSQTNFLHAPPKLNVDIPGTRTPTGKLGNSGPANLDLHFEWHDVFSDVKVFKDNVAEILDGVIEQVMPGCPALTGYEYPRDCGFDEVKTKRPAIAAELQRATAGGAQPAYIRSAAVPKLVFRFSWDRRPLILESSYNPYRHAEHNHRLPFQHAKKFVMDRPFFLTFVVFPWFNGVVTSFLDTNRIFYRSMARRVFCQYRRDDTAFSQWTSFSGTESVYEVSQHLVGLLFLEDKTILGSDPTARNVDGYLYLNPNAHQRNALGTMKDYFQSLRLVEYDDFSHDNY